MEAKKKNSIFYKWNPFRRIGIAEDAESRAQQAVKIIAQCDATIAFAEYQKELAVFELTAVAKYMKDKDE